MRRSLPIAITLLLLCSSFAPDNYKDYVNARFSFYIQYPAGFSRPKESQNGDGAVMTSADGKAEVRCYGSLLDSDLAPTIKEEYALAISGTHVVYHLIKGNMVIFSGTDSATGNTVYQKTILKKIDYFSDPEVPVFQTLRISYPAAQQQKYSAYCALISKSLQ